MKTRNYFVRPSSEWLRRKYEDERIDANALAKVIGVDGKTVWGWLRKIGVQTRPRGSNGGALPQAFKPGVSHRTGTQLSHEARQKIGAATRARKGVPYLVNGVHWMKATGRKPANYKGGITPERQTFYRSPEWKACGRAVWKRDNACCQRCGLDYRTVDRKKIHFALHHINSFQIVASRAEPSNVVLLCSHCHYWVHSRANTAREFLGEGHAFSETSAA